jgi:hypothetical protein
MSMNIEHLEESFDLIAPRGDEVVDQLYERIFVVAPHLRDLFPADPTKQRTSMRSCRRCARWVRATSRTGRCPSTTRSRASA